MYNYPLPLDLLVLNSNIQWLEGLGYEILECVGKLVGYVELENPTYSPVQKACSIVNWMKVLYNNWEVVLELGSWHI